MNSQEDVSKLRSIPEPQTVTGNELRKPELAWGCGESLGSDDKWGGAWPGGWEFPDFSSAADLSSPWEGFPKREEILWEHTWGKRGAGLPGNSVCKGTCLPPGRTGLAQVPQPDDSPADMGTDRPLCWAVLCVAGR